MITKINWRNNLQQLNFYAFVVFALYMTAIHNGFYFKWAESLSLFINSWYFLQDCMRFAGGLLTYTGAFLTQFYYFPALGSIVFVALLVLIQYLSVVAFDIPLKFRVLAYIPSLMLLLSVIQLGYVWLTLKSPGYFLSNTLGTIVCLVAFWGYRSLTSIGWRMALLVSLTVLGYPLFGFYALLSVSLFVFYEVVLFFDDRNYLHFLPALTGIALAIVIPQVYYNYVYSYMQHVHVYTSGLPRFTFDSKELIFWVPFLLLFLTIFLFLSFTATRKDKPVKSPNSYVSILAFCSGILMVFILSFNDDNFKTEIKMASAIEKNNFREVLYFADRVHGVPTRNIVLNSNMARIALGMPKNSGFNLNNTVKPKCVRSSMPIILHMSGRPLFYLSGQINDCYHWCMEDMVEYGMKPCYLKFMVKCAIINKEYELARKYNTILSETLFYRKWARKYQAYINDPSLTIKDTEITTIQTISEQGFSSDLRF